MPKFTRECLEIHQNTRDQGVHGSLQVDQRAYSLVHHAVRQYAAGCHLYLGDSIWKFDRSGVFLCEYGLDLLICSVRIALFAGRKPSPTLQTFTYLAVM
jgi:hypothetical protein